MSRTFFKSTFANGLVSAPRNCGKQRHLEQFIVGQRIRPGAEEALAQPLAMAVIMRLLGGLIVGWGRLAGHRHKHAVPHDFCNSELPGKPADSG